jgi:hypothetical protein
LQDKALNYAVVVTGFLLAAITGWVLRYPAEAQGLFKATEANTKGIVLVTGYVVILELLLCSWIYHTYMCLNIHAYLSLLAGRLGDHLPDKRSVLRYQQWWMGQDRPGVLRGFFTLIKFLQPLVVYGLVAVGVACLVVLCLTRACSMASNLAAFVPLLLPFVLLVTGSILLCLHFHVTHVALLSPEDMQKGREDSHAEILRP